MLGVRFSSMAIMGLFAMLPVQSIAKQPVEPAFNQCDHYGTPRPPKPDETPKPAWQWGDFYNGQVTAAAYGQSGIQACDAALANPLLIDAYWRRRASLLQARALHQLGAKDNAGALATLDQADALLAQKHDPAMDRTLGLGNQVLRAVALYRDKHTDQAEALLAKVDASRPYSLTVAGATGGVRMIFNYSRADHTRLMRDRVRLDPHMLHTLFWLSLDFGEFEDALTYADALTFDLPRSHGGWTLVGGDRQYDLIEQRATTAGGRAYALSALGRDDEALKVMTAAKGDVDDAMQPPPPPADGAKLSKRVQADYDARKAAGQKALTALTDWANAIRIRQLAAKTAFSDVSAIGQPLGGDAVIVRTDILRQFKPINLAEASAIQALITKIEDGDDVDRRKALAMNLNELARTLPGASDADSLPKMRGEGLNIWRTNLEGYAIASAEDPALFNVRFSGLSAPKAALEEAAVLIAAREAQKRGKDGFILEAVQRISRSLTTYSLYSYRPSGSSPAGYEVRYLVRPVDVATLTPEQAKLRVIRVADVLGALQDVYPMQP